MVLHCKHIPVKTHKCQLLYIEESQIIDTTSVFLRVNVKLLEYIFIQKEMIARFYILNFDIGGQRQNRY